MLEGKTTDTYLISLNVGKQFLRMLMQNVHKYRKINNTLPLEILIVYPYVCENI